MAVDNVGVDVCVKFGDSRSNGFPDNRGAGFVSNEHDEAYPNSAKRLIGLSPKNGERYWTSHRLFIEDTKEMPVRHTNICMIIDQHEINYHEIFCLLFRSCVRHLRQLVKLQ